MPCLNVRGIIVRTQTLHFRHENFHGKVELA
jgi:hypothetical protein